MTKFEEAEMLAEEMTKFEEAEMLVDELDCDYDLAFDLVYGIGGDPEETDDAL